MLIRILIALSLAVAGQAAMANEKALTRIESEEVFNENENYAIVIGVDQYDEVAPLNYAAADAMALSSFFESQGYQVSTLLNSQASKRRVLAQIKAVARVAGSQRKPRGNIVFVYSGHGFREDKINYLAPAEIDPTRLKETGISLQEVSDVLESANVRQRALFIDACRNDPGKGPANLQQRFEVDSSAEGLAILYSTGAGDLSYEDPGLNAGVFSHYLLEGFKGGAAESDGLVSFDQLSSYVQNNVKKHVLSRYKKAQIPYIGGERSGEFVLARADLEFNEVSHQATRLTVRRSPPDAAVEFVDSDVVYQDAIELQRDTEYEVSVSRSGYLPFSTLYKPSGLESETLDVQLKLAAIEREVVPQVAESQEKGGFLVEPKKPRGNLWKIVGGVVVVALIAGAAAGGDEGTVKPVTPPPTVGLTIQVPIK